MCLICMWKIMSLMSEMLRGCCPQFEREKPAGGSCSSGRGEREAASPRGNWRSGATLFHHSSFPGSLFKSMQTTGQAHFACFTSPGVTFLRGMLKRQSEQEIFYSFFLNNDNVFYLFKIFIFKSFILSDSAWRQPSKIHVLGSQACFCFYICKTRVIPICKIQVQVVF